MAQSYAIRDNFEKAQAEFNNAIRYYKKLTQENPQSQIEFKALWLIANCFIASKRWQEAVNVLEEVLMKYPEPQYLSMKRVDRLVQSINSVSVAYLKDYDLPINIYQKFIKMHPAHPFNKYLEGTIVDLSDLKEKNSSGVSK